MKHHNAITMLIGFISVSAAVGAAVVAAHEKNYIGVSGAVYCALLVYNTCISGRSLERREKADD